MPLQDIEILMSEARSGATPPPSNESRSLDPDAWVDRHGDALYRYGLMRLGDPEVAAELVQETFLQAYRGRSAYRGQASERTWLVAILRHKLIDHTAAARAAKSRPILMIWGDESHLRWGRALALRAPTMGDEPGSGDGTPGVLGLLRDLPLATALEHRRCLPAPGSWRISPANDVCRKCSRSPRPTSTRGSIVPGCC